MSAPSGDLIEVIRRYVPGIRADNSRHGFERIVILLLGFVGNGKSSLINSCICVVKDDVYRNLAGAGKDEGGRTMERTTHQLTDTIYITDNRGFKKMAPEEILEVSAQLRHLRPVGNVNWEKDNLKETLRYIEEVNKRPKELLLPVIVHSCLYNFKEDEENSMRELIKKCQHITKIPPIVVITNVGFPSTESGTEIKTRFGDMGCTNRICLENYTENKKDRSQEADDQFLHFLEVCTNEAEYRIKQKGRIDQPEIFPKRVIDQIKEENDMKERRMRRELQNKDKKVKELEEKLKIMEEMPWYKRCLIM
ncbi:uncharacterized protein ACMZJ9_010298 [Mantella aurantiaca]